MCTKSLVFNHRCSFPVETCLAKRLDRSNEIDVKEPASNDNATGANNGTRGSNNS